ncbi:MULTISPECIES: NUDIX domain-containing protein [Elizabethkingia]|uniref:NUDIX domain n=1 Tax=Elizabethkingia anophelis TaxID=1117645 RepID=X5L3P8_9FLAO|nr:MULTISPECIES: NUDIX domain-containing protein [Elizabethkingia]AQW95695.1 NUDIX hydrolase [Elizabethkingia anophelis]AQX02979.1 NUDIX hydrolase [Elizabethkingia anophelis]AVF49133.1 NUDIX domain-containing protein [Elizabethkingia anophelis]AVF53129.1 NUDIX domain-containing protein [Elizabethkingia anophelis]EQB94031.1 NUDIX hydrolase [Elizabethkingia anophelis 502]
MEKIEKFNVRVYALCIEDQKILTLFESYAGEKLVKLPGGGLEFGEGIIDCLHREFMEELNVKIEVLEHFYTQEGFMQSRFRDNEQLLTVYYIVKIIDPENFRIIDTEIEKAEWLPISASNPFPLPIDHLVFEKLQKKFLK